MNHMPSAARTDYTLGIKQYLIGPETAWACIRCQELQHPLQSCFRFTWLLELPDI